MDKSRVYEEVMKRFRQASTAKFTSEKFRKVETALWLLEGELNRMLGQHSLDFWFPTLRSSIAEQGGAIHREDIFRASHAILKFGRRDADATGEENIDQVRAAELASDVWAILTSYRAVQNSLRRIGKGGVIQFGLHGEPIVTLPPDKEGAVASYDRRRRFDELFTDQAVPFSRSDKQGHYIVCMGVRSDGPARFQPLVLNAYEVCALLQQYDEPLEFTHGLTPEDLCHCLVALSTLILEGSKESDKQFIPQRIDDPVTTTGNDRLNIDTFCGIAPLGYLKLSHDELSAVLSEAVTPWRRSEPDKGRIAKQFLARFSAVPSSAVNMERNEGASLLLPAGSSASYLDFCNMYSSLTSLVQDGKRYFEGHHGDRFATHLANRIKRFAPEYVCGLKVKFQRSGDLPKGDADLILLIDGVTFCVECKARAINDKLFRGEMEEGEDRLDKWEGAIKQAKDAAEHLARGSFVSLEWESMRKSVRSYEPIVCSITTEYIYPPDKFGTTPQGLPRLCSMTELLAFCEQKKRGA